MLSKFRAHLTYANVISTLCLVLVLGGGAAYAANTVLSTDIVNGEVKTADLAVGAVNSSKIAAGGVKTGDMAPESVNSSRVADNSLTGSDIADNGLTGSDIADESLTDEEIDELSLHGLIHGSGFAGGRARVLPPSSYGTLVGQLFGDPLPFNLFYDCPPSPSSHNGGVRFENFSEPINLFADDGGTEPSFAGELAAGAQHVEAAAFGGEYIVLSAQYPDGRVAVINVFSRHRADECLAQAQVVFTR